MCICLYLQTTSQERWMGTYSQVAASWKENLKETGSRLCLVSFKFGDLSIKIISPLFYHPVLHSLCSIRESTNFNLDLSDHTAFFQSCYVFSFLYVAIHDYNSLSSCLIQDNFPHHKILSLFTICKNLFHVGNTVRSQRL